MIVCIDLETTGLDLGGDEIIEVAMIKFDEETQKVCDSFSTLIKPSKKLPELISQITNIYPEDLEGAPHINDMKQKIVEFIGDHPILGHNISFDVSFLEKNGISLKNNIALDTFFLANICCSHLSSLNLEFLSQHYSISLEGAHRAMNDVKATIALFFALRKELSLLSKEKQKGLYYIFSHCDHPSITYWSEMLFGEHGFLIDYEWFEKSLYKAVGKYTFDNGLKDKKEHNIEYSDENIIKILSTIPGCETRENQESMMKQVIDIFSNQSKGVIEAATGLGKSFAYLIPAIFHSVKTSEKVYISTKTKALQDQLYEKDLLKLSQIIPFSFSYAKLKGRKNYLSIRSYLGELSIGNLVYEKVGFLSKIMLWLYETKYGELEELSYYGKEFYFLPFVNAENIDISSGKYKEFEFFYKARKKREDSDIVIINHALLFSDVKSSSPLLSDMSHLIVDEAHNIEDTFTESLKQKISLKQMEDTFSHIEKIFSEYSLKKVQILNHMDQALSYASFLFEDCSIYLSQKISTGSSYKNILIQDDFYSIENLSLSFQNIKQQHSNIVDILSTIDVYDFSKEISIIKSFSDILETIVDTKGDSIYIKTIQETSQKDIIIEHTLLNPGEHLEQQIWSKMKGVLLTSATLSIGGSFEYIKKILGLSYFDFFSYESDFDYAKQSVLFLPNDLGSIKNNSQEVISFLGKFFAVISGKCLTLFTSFNMIRKCYTSLKGELQKKNIQLYAQSIGGSKKKIMHAFLQKPENSILLGTDSFWEGIDLPGEKLKYLIIHKFPFPVPTDPVFQARSQFFDDPFLEYSIPKASIKLKQGFGRLIRSRKDSGMVILLDDRIVKYEWGKYFFNAFPLEINIKKGSSESLIETLLKKELLNK